MLGKTAAACRQMVHRARERVSGERRRFEVDEPTRLRMLERFIKAVSEGDIDGVKALDPQTKKLAGNRRLLPDFSREFQGFSMGLREERLELSRVAPLDPKSSASASSATRATLHSRWDCVATLYFINVCLAVTLQRGKSHAATDCKEIAKVRHGIPHAAG